jgi:hypothetical protein
MGSMVVVAMAGSGIGFDPGARAWRSMGRYGQAWAGTVCMGRRWRNTGHIGFGGVK